MKMSDLPWDLVEEILSWVPAISLKRLRSTCKRWNALFKDPGFSEKHFRKAQKQSHVLMLKEDRLCSMSVDLNVVPPSIEFKDALGLKDPHSNSEQVDIAKVFHCDGLLLCITKDYKPVVWNPCLGETRWNQHKKCYNRDCRFALGYESNQSCRSYKTLMFWVCYQTNNLGEFEIYEFNSNSWRVVIAPNCLRIDIYRGVTLKGNTYWIAVDDNKDKYLLNFDFTRERFRRLYLPPSVSLGYMALSVVREEELSVLCFNNFGSYELEMWVTKKIDTEAELSWSKSFAVDTRRNGLSVFTSLLLDEEKKVALCNNSCYFDSRHMVYTIGEDNEYYTEISYIKERFSWSPPFIFNYVPSLVQIQSK